MLLTHICCNARCSRDKTCEGIVSRCVGHRKLWRKFSKEVFGLLSTQKGMVILECHQVYQGCGVWQ